MERVAIPFLNDPVGNTIAVITLIFMLVSAVAVIFDFLSGKVTWFDRRPGWLIPILAFLGILVSSYLYFVESSNSTPFCGPVGDCGKVQNSSYAMLFGFIPVGLLGLLGYSVIAISWLVAKLASKTSSSLIFFGIWVFAWFGLLFSIYLTFLEPFIIGATCLWCISSAIIMTLILWVSTGQAKIYWSTLGDET